MEAETMAQTLLRDVAQALEVPAQQVLAQQALARSRIFDLRNLQVDQDGDSVVLRGRVDSFYHKQLAQELVRASLDGTEVINAITVDYRREFVSDDFSGRW
jgi:hypothetical protein